MTPAPDDETTLRAIGRALRDRTPEGYAFGLWCKDLGYLATGSRDSIAEALDEWFAWHAVRLDCERAGARTREQADPRSPERRRIEHAVIELADLLERALLSAPDARRFPRPAFILFFWSIEPGGFCAWALRGSKEIALRMLVDWRKAIERGTLPPEPPPDPLPSATKRRHLN